jgi:hypothetical protein
MSVPVTVPGFNAGQPYLVGGTDAGQPIRPLHAEARLVYNILAPDVEILPDTRSDSFGLAWYRGLNTQGWPRFAVRDDVVLNRKIAYHEAGHEFMDVLRLRTGASAWDLFQTGAPDVLARYWQWRGFPGIWQDAHMQALAQADWTLYPSESWAEAFSAAVIGNDPYMYQWAEWTASYQLGLAGAPGIYDPIGGAMRARVFFLDLMRELAGEEDDMFTDQDRTLLQRVKDLLEAEGTKVWIARNQRVLDVETGKPFNPNTTPLDPRIKQ